VEHEKIRLGGHRRAILFRAGKLEAEEDDEEAKDDFLEHGGDRDAEVSPQDATGGAADKPAPIRAPEKPLRPMT
jgi:hypothetical protein